MVKKYRVALYLNMALLHQQGMARGAIRYSHKRENWELFGAYWPMLAVKDFAKWRGDGIIAAVESNEDIEMLTRSGVPVVDTSGAIYHPSLSLVSNDNVEIGRIGGEYLADNGFDSFAFCAADGSMWSEERLRGFRAAVGGDRAEIAVFRKKISWWHGPEFSRELSRFLSECPKPVGVMSANDIIGMNVVGSCRLAGLRIPEDVSLVSVDNEELLCELSDPPLSSVPFDRDELGFRAAERLDVLMRGLAPSMPALRIQPRQLVERASSSILAVNDPLVVEALSFIRKNVADGVSAGDVADRLFTSRRNLERRFRKQMGRSILEEIHKTRIRLAKRLLAETDAPAGKVSFQCGFKTYDRFKAVFCHDAGMTPKEYRNRKREIFP